MLKLLYYSLVLTYFVHKHAVSAADEPEDDQVIEQDLLKGRLVERGAQVDQPSAELSWPVHFSACFWRCGVSSVATTIREVVGYTLKDYTK